MSLARQRCDAGGGKRVLDLALGSVLHRRDGVLHVCPAETVALTPHQAARPSGRTRTRAATRSGGTGSASGTA